MRDDGDYTYGESEYSDNYDTGGYDSNYIEVPTVKNYLKWILLPTILGIFTCGIGTLVLLIVWACSKDETKLARRNLVRAQLVITCGIIVLYIVLFIIAAIFGTAFIKVNFN